MDTSTVVDGFDAISEDMWRDLIGRAKDIGLAFLYGRTWRGAYLDVLRDAVERGTRLRVVLPSPEAQGVLEDAAARLGVNAEEVARRIREAAQDFRELKGADVRYSDRPLAESLYLFDESAIIAFLSYRVGRRDTPAVLAAGSVANFAREEFAALFEAAAPIRSE
jgi:hypothetical protein